MSATFAPSQEFILGLPSLPQATSTWLIYQFLRNSAKIQKPETPSGAQDDSIYKKDVFAVKMQFFFPQSEEWHPPLEFPGRGALSTKKDIAFFFFIESKAREGVVCQEHD